MNEIGVEMRANSRGTRRERQERGIALPMALICLFIISALAAGVIMRTQYEIHAATNYRTVTQARYVAEAGSQQAVNWLQRTWQPPTNLADNAVFNRDSFPVKYISGNKNVVLASDGMNNITDTYGSIDSTMDTTFKNLFNTSPNNTVPKPSNGNFTGTFKVAAQLLTAQQQSSGEWRTTWKVFSQGVVGSAMVQVVEVVNEVKTNSGSSSVTPNFNFAVFATGTGCNVISMAGSSGRTDSYDSAIAGNKNNTSPTQIGTGGDVGAKGNISITNGAKVIGNVFSPLYNTGAAGTYGIANSAGNGMNSGNSCNPNTPSSILAVNQDNSGSQVGCTVSGGTTTCPDANSGYYNKPVVYNQRTYALPTDYTTLPDPLMPTVTQNTAACAGYNGLCNGGSGGGSGCAITIPPSTLPNNQAGTGAANFGKANFGSCAVITLQAGTYNFDTLYISNGARIIIPTTGGVTINVLNQSGASTPLSIDGGTVSNSGGDPNNLTFVYKGTNTVNLAAGANMFATVYAPNAPITLSGNAGLFGAAVGKSFSFGGSAHVIYDINLKRQPPRVPITGSTPIISNLHVDQFSWSVF